jgi:hypothetical protein
MRVEKSRKKGRVQSYRHFPAELGPTVLAIFGTAVLGYATFLQFTKAPEASENRSRLQRSQLVVELAEITRDQWQIALDQELIRDKPNQSMLAETAFGNVSAAARWRALMLMRVAKTEEEYRSAISERESIIAHAETLRRTGDVDGLLKMNQTFVVFLKGRNELRELDDRFFVAVDEANMTDARIAKRVVGAYILGSIIMLISAVASTLLSNWTLNKIEDQLHSGANDGRRILPTSGYC